MNPYLKENILNWISEFDGDDAVSHFPKKLRQACGFFLQEVVMACVEKAGDVVEQCHLRLVSCHCYRN